MAILAGVLALWVTFTPCFLWIFLAGPYLDTLSARPRLAAALQAITAAVVGVILNLSVWFALHVLFGTVRSLGAMPLPDLATLNLTALGLTLLAALLLLRLRLGLPATLAISATAGLLVGVIGG